jgi:hypothetical protein
VLFNFEGDRVAQLTRQRGSLTGPSLSLEVLAERGTARLEYPRRLQWSDSAGRHSHESPRAFSLGMVLLRRFHEAITQGEPVQSSLEDAQRILGWLRSAARSCEEGRRVALS